MRRNSNNLFLNEYLVGICNLDEEFQQKIIPYAFLLKLLDIRGIKVCNIKDLEDNCKLPVEEELFVLVKSKEIHEKSFWLVKNPIFRVQDVGYILLKVFGVYRPDDVRVWFPKAEDVKMYIGFKYHYDTCILSVKK